MLKPISDVTDADVSFLITAMKSRGAKRQAQECLKRLRTFFEWSMLPHRRDVIGLKGNPIATLTPTRMVLPNTTRSRHFGFLEIKAYTTVAARTPYPYGPFARALIQLGQRQGTLPSHFSILTTTWRLTPASAASSPWLSPSRARPALRAVIISCVVSMNPWKGLAHRCQQLRARIHFWGDSKRTWLPDDRLGVARLCAIHSMPDHYVWLSARIFLPQDS
ncbi:hypothetical protein BC360_27140 [Ensifer sp. LC163]|nr:hypothetical protein BC360_27140 [Ensifer sp. LC163]